MFLKDLKKNMILPTKEILIDKIVKIRGIDVHLVSITSEEHRNVLWLMYQMPYDTDELTDLEEREEYTSNRDEMINNISKRMKQNNFYISEIYIQNQKMTFSSSSSGCIKGNPYEGYMRLQHFIESGMSTTNWDEVNVSNIVIAAYEQREQEEFPEIDFSKKLDIKIKINKEFKQVLINQPIQLKFGEVEKGNKLYFYDSMEKKERIFYIDKMEHYDIWEDANKKFNSEEMQAFPKEQIQQMKENYLACLKETCPKGMNLAIIEYETEDDVQLDFYSKEYLDKKPIRKNSSSTMMFFKSDKKLGINGFKSRVSMIMPVEKEFNGSIDAELFSWYLEIPEEVITVG